MFKARFVAAVAAVWIAGLGVAMWSADTAQAQAPAGGTGPIWAGVYTAAQAENGEATFMGRCAGCHRPDLRGGPNGPNYAPPLGGDEFMLRWDSNTVNRLFRIIRDTMPRGTPGILGEQTTLDVVSFILKFNGYPAGMSALTADAAALEKITFVPKAGEAAEREIANFAPVEAVGCLTRGPSAWMLTQASDVKSATTAPPAPDAALGAQSYRLVSVAAFGLDARTGAKVRVKGIIRRDPDETLVNLTAVDTLAASCGG